MKQLIPIYIIGLTSILAVMPLSFTQISEGYGQAQSEVSASESVLSFADRKVGVVNQLRWLNQSLRELRLQINPELSLREDELARLLQESSLGQLSGQSLEVSLKVTQALKRKSINRLIAYPQLLMTLGDALFGVNLEKIGLTRLRDALTKLNTTPRHFERAMIALFEQGRGTLSAQDVVTYWTRYQSLCQRLSRPTSAAAHYVFAKALYFTGAYAKANQELKRVIQQPGYQARALYIQGVIKLIEEDWDGAFTLFLGLKTQLDRYVFQYAPTQNQRIKETQGQVKVSKKVISKRPRVQVTQIKILSDTGSEMTSDVQQVKGDLGLSPDLRALLEEVTQGEPLRSLGTAPALEEGQMLSILQTILSMALARIAVLKGDLVSAWQFYRQVPSGSPLYQESLLEAAYTMKVRRDYERCAELLSLAIAAYPSSEAALDLRLWQAEMLARDRQSLRVRQLYSVMNKELTQQEQVLINAEQSKVLFAPEVLAWIPRESAQRARMLGQRLRELEIWLAQSRRHLEALKRASRAQKYPALDQGVGMLQQTLRQLDRLAARLPRLIDRWRSLDQTSSKASGQGTSGQDVEVEVSRGVQFNQRSTARFAGEAILASVMQLKRRAERMSQEISERRKAYQAQLSKILNREERAVSNSETQLKRLKRLTEEYSRKARVLALKRVRGFKAQLELGPILQDFWIKEAATDLLEQARMMSLKRQIPLRQLNDQEIEAPPTLSTLDLLAPAIQRYIISPLPDPEKN